MTLVVPYSISSISFVCGTTITQGRHNHRTGYNPSRRFVNVTSSSRRITLPLSACFKLFPQHERIYIPHQYSRNYMVSAAGTDIAVGEANSPVTDEDLGEAPEISSSEVEASDESSSKSDATSTPAQSKRSRAARKSEMPPLKNEELVPGAEFTGKVRSIQPFGAFIDFGAFTDGLVHVSRLSDSYVKDVASCVSIGQEVKVRLVEANLETGRISLTMRESDGNSKLQQQKDVPLSNEKSKPSRKSSSKAGKKRDEVAKVSKFVKGQNLEGTVKNMTRSGAFISLPEGEEGFLPTAEESDDGFGNTMGGSSLQVGQEVSVRVLRVSRGQVTLTMKTEGDTENLDSPIFFGVVHAATNPFVLAFRKNKDIAAFLDERKKMEKEVQDAMKPNPSDAIEGKEEALDSKTGVPGIQETPTSDEETVTIPAVVDVSTNEDLATIGEADVGADVKDDDKFTGSIVTGSSENLDNAPLTLGEQAENLELFPSEASLSPASEVADEASSVDVVDSSIESGDEKASVEEVLDKQADSTTNEHQLQTPSAENDISSNSQNGDKNVGTTIGNNGSVTDLHGQTANPSSENSVAKATISPALVKQLREETGAGMMDCKKALSGTGGDIIKAQEYLRKKGLASAEKKASRVTAEGRIGSYIHDSRIGVLIEVNCETDFVSRGDIFKDLVDDLAMQVAACPQVEYLTTEDVPDEIVNKEKDIEMQKEDLLSKPEQIREKIVEGRIRKRLEELALLEQPYIKNDKVVIKDWVKQTIATIGENINVKRFVRYNLGEGLEKKSQDFVAEVAAQTAAKPVTIQGNEQPASVEAKETDQKPPTIAVSAALVKQLREETGAGMMDCKKALSETGGDLEKAQEYLRKKGLSTADKKSSRLAAEGRIGSYIHDSRIGVLIEVNCETDFVGRSEKFKELVDDLAMQVVACPQVQCVSVEDVPESIVNKEKELEMQREDLFSKPEHIREKIVEGRVSKRLGELALLQQPFIKDDSILVKDLVKQTVAALGENIKVRRFVRFTLGETTDSMKSEPEA